MVSREGFLKKTSGFLNAVVVGGMSLWAAHLVYGGKIPPREREAIIKALPPEEIPNPREVKIGEKIITFGGLGKDSEIVPTPQSTTDIGILKEKLSYLGEYMKRPDPEFEFFKQKPSIPGVCDFFVKLISNENSKQEMRVVWDFILKNKANPEIAKALSNLFSASSVPLFYSASEKHWSGLLSKPAVDADFQRHYESCISYVTKIPFMEGKVQKIRVAMREMFEVVISELSKGMESKTEAEQKELGAVVNALLNLTYEKLPETNR